MSDTQGRTDNEQTEGLSRRSFIKGAALTAVAAAGASLAGCATDGAAKAAQAGSDVDMVGQAATDTSNSVWVIGDLGTPTETMKTDVCVIGAGGTGMAAGIQCKQLGVDVICIEKENKTGGSFIGSEGLFAVGSHWQKAAGANFNANEIVQACLDFHHWVPSPALYENFFNHTAGTVDWLESLGVEFDHVQTLGDSWNTWHVYKGVGSEGTGVTFMKSFKEAADAAGLDIELNLAGKKLIVDNGKITGVLAQRDNGDVVQIDCKAVVVGTGGYADNGAMIKQLNGADPEKVYSSGQPGRDGDGIKMMVNAGARMADAPGCIAFYGPILPGTSYGTPVQASTCMQPTIWVNQDAKRFIREDMFLKNFAYAGQACSKQARVLTICNRATLQRYQDKGADVGVGVYVNAGVPLKGLLDEFDTVLKTNKSIYQGDTIEDLAKAAGLDAETLKETFLTHESYVAPGVDLEFGKPSKYLFSMAEGPYYAFDVNDGIFCTCGAIKVTPDTQVLDTSDKAITGLYAGGCDAGGFYGDTYDVGIAGGSCASWAINSGRLAAKHAAQYIGYSVKDM